MEAGKKVGVYVSKEWRQVVEENYGLVHWYSTRLLRRTSRRDLAVLGGQPEIVSLCHLALMTAVKRQSFGELSTLFVQIARRMYRKAIQRARLRFAEPISPAIAAQVSNGEYREREGYQDVRVICEKLIRRVGLNWRDLSIVLGTAQGKSCEELADEFQMTPRRVNQVVSGTIRELRSMGVADAF